MNHSVIEEDALTKFRQVTEGMENLESFDDDYLLRWLRARDLDIPKAKEMLANNLEWRKTNEIMLKDLSNWIPEHKIVEDIKYKFTGFDHDGRPVLYMPIGSWNIRNLLEDGMKEDVFRYLYKIMEEILNRISKSKGESGTTKIVAIFNVSGLSLWKIASIETLQSAKRFFREFESYYPEIVHKIFVINAHWVFHYGFKMVKNIISVNTIEKIQILTDKNSWKSTLLDTLPWESLSSIFDDNDITRPETSDSTHIRLSKHVSWD